MTDTFSRLDSRGPSASVFAESPAQGSVLRRPTRPAPAVSDAPAETMSAGLDGTQAFYVALHGRKLENPLAGAARFEQLRFAAAAAQADSGLSAVSHSPLRDRMASLVALGRDLQEQARRGGRVSADRVEDLESGLRAVHGEIAARFRSALPADATDLQRRAHYETHLLADSYNRLVGVADDLCGACGGAFLDPDTRIFPSPRFAARQQLLARLHELANLTRGEAGDGVAAVRSIATDYRVRLANLGGPGETATRPLDQAMRRYFNRIIDGFQTAHADGAPFLRPSEEAAFERLKFPSDHASVALA